MQTEANIRTNEILYVIAKNMKVDELQIELKTGKYDHELKKAKYIPATNLLHHFCARRNMYIMDEEALTFETVRQWGLHATHRRQKLSVKGVTFVGDKTIAWHEANGEK